MRNVWAADEEDEAPEPYIGVIVLPPGEVDKRLSGIANRWALREIIGVDQKIGALLVLLPDPALVDAVKGAVEREVYRGGGREDLNTVAAWHKARTQRSGSAFTSSDELYGDFVEWLRRRDVPFTGGRRTFVSQLKRLGLRHARSRSTGRYGFFGVRSAPAEDVSKNLDTSTTAATAAASTSLRLLAPYRSDTHDENSLL